MKKIAIALLVTAAALAANTAKAETHVRIGVNVGGPVYRPAPPVVVAPPPAVVYAPAPVVVAVPAPRGYWKEVQVKTWVPERHVIRHNRWGRAERICEPGYFTYTTQRVWVDRDDRYTHNDRHGHGHHYGHDRNHNNGWRR